MNLVNDDAKIQAASYIDEDAAKVLVCDWVNLYEDSSFKKSTKVLLLLTEFSFSLFKKKFVGRSLMCANEYNFTHLEKVWSDLESQLLFVFQGKSFYISHGEARAIMRLISKAVVDIYPNSQIPEFDPPPPEPRERFAVINRYRFLCFSKNIKPLPEVLSFLESYCGKMVIDFHVLPSSCYSQFNMLLDTIQICDFRTIRIPKVMESHWEELANYLKANQTIRKVETEELINSGFEKIKSIMKDVKSSKLTSFSFTNSGFTEPFIHELSILYKSLNLTCLIFNNAIAQTIAAAPYFHQKLTSGTFSMLTRFEIENTPSIDYRVVLKECPKLRHFAFRKCGVKLDALFTDLSKLAHRKLEHVDFSGNIASWDIEQNFVLPSGLHKFELSDIQWTPEPLINLMKFLLQHQSRSSRLGLYFRNIKLSLQDQIEFNKSLSTLDGSKLTELFWDNNICTLDLMNFIKSCKNLSLLSFNNCLRPGDKALTEFTAFLSTTKSLQQLLLKSSDENKLANQFNTIIDAIALNRSLLMIDFSNQNMGLATLLRLAEAMMKNRVIINAVLIGNEIYQKEEFIKFFHVLNGRGTPLDLDMMTAKMKMDPLLEILLFRASTGNPNIEIPPENLYYADEIEKKKQADLKARENTDQSKETQQKHKQRKEKGKSHHHKNDKSKHSKEITNDLSEKAEEKVENVVVEEEITNETSSEKNEVLNEEKSIEKMVSHSSSHSNSSSHSHSSSPRSPRSPPPSPPPEEEKHISFKEDKNKPPPIPTIPHQLALPPSLETPPQIEDVQSEAPFDLLCKLPDIPGQECPKIDFGNVFEEEVKSIQSQFKSKVVAQKTPESAQEPFILKRTAPSPSPSIGDLLAASQFEEEIQKATSKPKVNVNQNRRSMVPSIPSLNADAKRNELYNAYKIRNLQRRLVPLK